jgi:hypothetical protein
MHGTGFAMRHAARMHFIERMLWAVHLTLAAYLAAHLVVVLQAVEIDGWINGVLTLFTFDLGDLYWGLRWLHEGDAVAPAVMALSAAAVSLGVLLTRSYIKRWMRAFAREMIDDTMREIERRRAGASSSEHRPGDDRTNEG